MYMSGPEWSPRPNNLSSALVFRERRHAPGKPLNQRGRGAGVLADPHTGECAPAGDRHRQQRLVLNVGTSKRA